MRSRSARSVVALGLAVLLGCQRQEPPPLPGTAGPAPLRRLSDSEYLNALRDLFPGPQLVLPRLPSEAVVAGFDNAAEAQQTGRLLFRRPLDSDERDRIDGQLTTWLTVAAAPDELAPTSAPPRRVLPRGGRTAIGRRPPASGRGGWRP